MKRTVPAVVFLGLLGACAGPAGPAHVRLPDAPPPGEPAGTTGLHEVDLKNFYGPPAFVRKDGTAQIWRFDGPACKAFFFLYARDGNTAVWHVETMPRGSAIAADQNCLNALHARVVARPIS